jgi:hypothetical protein
MIDLELECARDVCFRKKEKIRRRLSEVALVKGWKFIIFFFTKIEFELMRKLGPVEAINQTRANQSSISSFAIIQFYDKQ